MQNKLFLLAIIFLTFVIVTTVLLLTYNRPNSSTSNNITFPTIIFLERSQETEEGQIKTIKKWSRDQITNLLTLRSATAEVIRFDTDRLLELNEEGNKLYSLNGEQITNQTYPKEINIESLKTSEVRTIFNEQFLIICHNTPHCEILNKKTRAVNYFDGQELFPDVNMIWTHPVALTKEEVFIKVSDLSDGPDYWTEEKFIKVNLKNPNIFQLLWSNLPAAADTQQKIVAAAPTTLIYEKRYNETAKTFAYLFDFATEESLELPAKVSYSYLTTLPSSALSPSYKYLILKDDDQYYLYNIARKTAQNISFEIKQNKVTFIGWVEDTTKNQALFTDNHELINYNADQNKKVFYTKLPFDTSNVEIISIKL